MRRAQYRLDYSNGGEFLWKDQTSGCGGLNSTPKVLIGLPSRSTPACRGSSADRLLKVLSLSEERSYVFMACLPYRPNGRAAGWTQRKGEDRRCIPWKWRACRISGSSRYCPSPECARLDGRETCPCTPSWCILDWYGRPPSPSACV